MKPFTLVFLSLAPFLSLADAVDGAPTVANNNNNNMMARHRRAPAIESPASPLRRRHTDLRRQADNGTTSSDNGEPLLSSFLIIRSCFSPSCAFLPCTAPLGPLACCSASPRRRSLRSEVKFHTLLSLENVHLACRLSSRPEPVLRRLPSAVVSQRPRPTERVPPLSYAKSPLV
jgi:hypothetical protein